MAITQDGTLLALLEGPFEIGRASSETVRPAHIVYRLKPNGSKWEAPYTIARRGPYVPVGADVGPDGRLYILERHLSGIFGFTSQVRRFNIGKAGLSNETILVKSTIGAHDNLEGLSVWRDPQGLIRLTMVSDDNFNFFQTTEIVEYVVPQM